jgi:vesicle coat complex subunit
MNTEKKGELAELKASLRQLAGSRAPGSTEAKRELFKKVISYMTIGIDVSGLFTEMIMGSGATSDLVLKKMCYLYICSYAQSNSELALLTINFLQKDCQVSGASYDRLNLHKNTARICHSSGLRPIVTGTGHII